MRVHFRVVALILFITTLACASVQETRTDRIPSATPLEEEILRLLAAYPGTELLYLDIDARYMEIELNSFLASGTDYACAQASELFYELTSLADGEFILKVSNKWVPSLVNPMDVIWAARLAGLGGAPGTSSNVTVDEHRARITEALVERGIRRERGR